jgi:hypothetical protein
MIAPLTRALCLLPCAVHVHAQSMVVAPELWDRPRNGQAVMAEAAVKQAVNAYLAHSAARLVIHHSARQESVLQAEELRSWLVALAVESQRIGLVGDLRAGAPLHIEIVAER